MKQSRLYIALSLVFFLGSFKSEAQWDFSAGPKLGVNFSTYDSKFILFEPSRMRSSMMAGVFFKAQPFNEFYFQVEFIGLGKGANFDEQDSLPAFSLKTGHFEIPLIVGFSPRNDFLDVQAGLAFSRLLSAFQEIEGSNINVRDEFHDWDLSVVGGIGFEFQNGVGVNARMTYGIINALRDLQSNQVFTTAIQNFSLTFGVWYNIRIVKNRY